MTSIFKLQDHSMVCDTHPALRARILEIMTAHGEPMTNRQIVAQLGEVGIKALQPVTAHMVALGLIHVIGQVRPSNGQRLKLYALKPRVDNPTPRRTFFGAGTWLGTDWSRAMLRTGCQDHLQYPSRRGDARVFHRGHVITALPSLSKD